jgi:hypothetical protein
VLIPTQLDTVKKLEEGREASASPGTGAGVGFALPPDEADLAGSAGCEACAPASAVRLSAQSSKIAYCSH